MKAVELKDKLAEGLRGDTSGKTTPIQRLTPFLQALVQHLEEQEQLHVALGAQNFESDPVNSVFGTIPTLAGRRIGTLAIDHVDGQKDSSSSGTQIATASAVDSETGAATKATS